MKIINSLSGGKTSSYLAAHYPADYNIFSLVCTRDKSTKLLDDKLIQMVNDKFEKSGFLKYGEFIGTAEDSKVIKLMFDLEDYLDSEIIWVRGKYFDDLIKKFNYLPNVMNRWCTPLLKIDPIVEWAYKNTELPNFINLGIRYDEMERAKRSKEREIYRKVIVGQSKNGRNQWKEVFYGVMNYPLIYNKITNYQVQKFWEDKNLDFQKDSNCVGCFWKNVQQLRKNWDDNTEIMQWFSDQEIKTGHWFKNGIKYEQIKTIGIQMDFNFGTGSGCQAGFCTD